MNKYNMQSKKYPNGGSFRANGGSFRANGAVDIIYDNLLKYGPGMINQMVLEPVSKYVGKKIENKLMGTGMGQNKTIVFNGENISFVKRKQPTHRLDMTGGQMSNDLVGFGYGRSKLKKKTQKKKQIKKK